MPKQVAPWTLLLAIDHREERYGQTEEPAHDDDQGHFELIKIQHLACVVQNGFDSDLVRWANDLTAELTAS